MPRRTPKCPQISQKYQGFFVRAKNTRDKYRKNNKFNTILDLEKEETKTGPRMSVNIAKIAKVTRIFLASQKHP